MLSQAEIDALLGSGVPETDTPAVPIARPYKKYDFRRPDKYSKDQLRTLQAVHDNVARGAAARLSARLRTAVSIQLATAEQMVFDEYVNGLTLPTQLIVLRSDHLNGPILLDIDLSFALTAIERLLGGQGRAAVARHEPTAIEATLIGRIVDDIVPAFVEAWSHLAEVPLEIVERALGPALLRVAAPTEVVAVLTFEARLGGHAGTIAIAYPHQALQPLLAKLSATAWYAQADRSAANRDRSAMIAETISQAPIPVTAVLGSVSLPVEALANLQPGDVIRFDERADEAVGIWISDQVRSWGIPGRVGDRIALRLVSPLVPVEVRAQ